MLSSPGRVRYAAPMRLGILSDTHDHVDVMARALELLKREGAEFFLHCGDIGSERCIDLLVGLPAAFVWGNCDWDRAPLSRYAVDVGVGCHGTFGDLSFANKRVALIHGDIGPLKRRVLTEQQHAYVLQGHTHVREDTRFGQTRLINPGALSRAAVKTVAILDVTLDQLTFFRVD